MSDSCSWPNCRDHLSIIVSKPGKQIFLCDKHAEMVFSDDTATMIRARKKVNLPLPKIIGRVLQEDEKGARCCFPECRHQAVTVKDGRPVCQSHISVAHAIEFNGQWKKLLPDDKLDNESLNSEKKEEKSKREQKEEEHKEDTAFDMDQFLCSLNSGEFDIPTED